MVGPPSVDYSMLWPASHHPFLWERSVIFPTTDCSLLKTWTCSQLGQWWLLSKGRVAWLLPPLLSAVRGEFDRAGILEWGKWGGGREKSVQIEYLLWCIKHQSHWNIHIITHQLWFALPVQLPGTASFCPKCYFEAGLNNCNNETYCCNEAYVFGSFSNPNTKVVKSLLKVRFWWKTNCFLELKSFMSLSLKN